MLHDWESLAIAAVIGLPVVALNVWGMVATDRRLRRWAEAEGLTVVRKSRRLSIFRGPFIATMSTLDGVFRLTARDARGQVRSGWVRVSAPTVLTWREPIEVRWDA